MKAYGAVFGLLVFLLASAAAAAQADQSPLPESAAMLLFGAALIGLARATRKRFASPRSHSG
jgi:4-hydroxybenzoate polyprenyltransferase